MATRRICNSVKILPLTTPVGSIQLVHHLPFLNNRRSFATTKSCVQTTESLPATSLIWPPPYISPTWAALTKRGSNDPELILPDLICLPTDMILNRGNLYQTAYNWLFTRLLLPNIYNSFSIKSFMADAAAAIEPISQHLARQEYEKLHGLLTHETLAQAKRSIDKMTDVQRERIALKRYDIFKMHIQKVQWVYTGGARPDSCYAEISMVFHVHEPYRHDPKKLNEYLERYAIRKSFITFLSHFLKFLYDFPVDRKRNIMVVMQV